LALVRGQDEMVEICPVKGDPWVVNKGHILSMVQTNTASAEKAQYPSQKNGGTIRDVSVAEWLKWAKHKKHIHKLFHVGVDFPAADPLPLHPYFLGVLLGDGGLSIRGRVEITNVDEPVIQEVKRIGTEHKFHLVRRPQPDRAPTYAVVGGIGRIGRQKNLLRQALHDLGLIPFAAKIGLFPISIKQPLTKIGWNFWLA
jgi:hypothetical protein